MRTAKLSALGQVKTQRPPCALQVTITSAAAQFCAGWSGEIVCNNDTGVNLCVGM